MCRNVCTRSLRFEPPSVNSRSVSNSETMWVVGDIAHNSIGGRGERRGIDRTLTDDQPSVCVLENGFDPNRAGARCVSFGGPIRARIASRRWSKCFEKVFPCLLPTVIDGRHNGVALLLGEYRRETRCAADRVLVDVCETPRRGRVLRSPEHEPTPPASVVLFGI